MLIFCTTQREDYCNCKLFAIKKEFKLRKLLILPAILLISFMSISCSEEPTSPAIAPPGGSGGSGGGGDKLESQELPALKYVGRNSNFIKYVECPVYISAVEDEDTGEISILTKVDFERHKRKAKDSVTEFKSVEDGEFKPIENKTANSTSVLISASLRDKNPADYNKLDDYGANLDQYVILNLKDLNHLDYTADLIEVLNDSSSLQKNINSLDILENISVKFWHPGHKHHEPIPCRDFKPPTVSTALFNLGSEHDDDHSDDDHDDDEHGNQHDDDHHDDEHGNEHDDDHHHDHG